MSLHAGPAVVAQLHRGAFLQTTAPIFSVSKTAYPGGLIFASRSPAGTEKPLIAPIQASVAQVQEIVHPARIGEAHGNLKVLYDGGGKAPYSSVSVAEPSDAHAVRPSRPGFLPHQRVPRAVLPSGAAIAPDSFFGGYHGAKIDPARVLSLGGLPARGPVEDWRLQQHALQASAPASAFRGTTPFPTSPDGEGGASYWAGAGGWVYDIQSVPTWNVNRDLEGRVSSPDDTFKGNPMTGEVESAIPARVPLECIQRWGRVAEEYGKEFVPQGAWVVNPRYNAVLCRKFWGSAS